MQVTDCVPVEQLQDLQKQAEEVGWGAYSSPVSLLTACRYNSGDQLRKDNKELRETLDLLKGRQLRDCGGSKVTPKSAGLSGRYRSLLVENSELAQQARVPPVRGTVPDRS